MRGDTFTKYLGALKDLLSLHQLSARSELELMSLERKARSCSRFYYGIKDYESGEAGRGFRRAEPEERERPDDEM